MREALQSRHDVLPIFDFRGSGRIRSAKDHSRVCSIRSLAIPVREHFDGQECPSYFRLSRALKNASIPSRNSAGIWSFVVPVDC